MTTIWDFEKINKKEFSFYRSRIIRYLFDRGVVFVGFKINCSVDSDSFSDKFCSFEEAFEKAKDLNKSYIAGGDLAGSIDLLDFASSNIKISKEDNSVNLHVLIGYRSVAEFNDSILFRIRGGFI